MHTLIALHRSILTGHSVKVRLFLFPFTIGKLTMGSYVSVRSSSMKHEGSLESTKDA